VVSLLGVLTGCVSSSPRRPAVAARLEERTGHQLGVATKPAERSVPASVNLEDGISQDEAVALALWNNAGFHEALTKLGFSRADVLQAGLLANPTLSVLFPLGPKQLEYTLALPLEAAWLRPRRVALAQIEEQRVAESLVQNGLDLIRDVKHAYSDWVLANDRLRLARDAAQLQSRIAELAEARLKAGDISELETATARIDAARAREEIRRLATDVTVARERLRTLAGLGFLDRPCDFSDTPASPDTHREVGELLKQARAARPDLRAAELGLEAAGKRAGLAKAEIFTLSAVLDANTKGREGHELGPGVQLPIPVFNRNQAGRARAQAELERAAWDYVAVKERIELEVSEAHTRLRQAREALAAWRREIVPPLEENVRQAEKAYQAGATSLLLVYENTRQLNTARLREMEAAAELRRARAELERSVGRRLDSELQLKAPRSP